MMANYDILDIAVMLRDAQRSLRSLYNDYDTKAEPCRNMLRRIMNDLQTDEVLKALTHAMQTVVDANGGENGDMKTIQVHSLWLMAAAKDLLDEQHAASVADKIKELLTEHNQKQDYGKENNHMRD